MPLNQCPFNIDHGLSQCFLIKLLTATSFLQKYQHFQFCSSFPNSSWTSAPAKSLGCSYLYTYLSFKDRDISPLEERTPLSTSPGVTALQPTWSHWSLQCPWCLSPALCSCPQLSVPAPFAPAALPSRSRDESGPWPLKLHWLKQWSPPWQ